MVSLHLPYRSITSIMGLLALVLVLVSHLPAHVEANYEHYCDSGSYRTQANGQCGDNLATTILTLCRALSNSFMGKYIMKRMPQKSITNNKRLSDLSLSKSEAFTYLLSKRQGDQNVVCECCVNRCSFTEMYQYCELPPLSFKRGIRGDQYSMQRHQEQQQQQQQQRHYQKRQYNLEDSNYLGST